METVCVKLNEDFIKDMKKFMKRHHYATKTEFIRETLREKIASEAEKEKMMAHVRKLYGVSKLKTTDEDIQKVREKLAREYERNPEKFFRSLRNSKV